MGGSDDDDDNNLEQPSGSADVVLVKWCRIAGDTFAIAIFMAGS